MRKLLLTLLFLLTAFITIGQESYFITIGLDPKLAIKGAYDYDTTPVLDISFKTGTRLENNVEVGIGFEYAKLKSSYTASKLYVNKVFFNWRENLAFAIGPEIVMIDRGRYEGSKKINPPITYGLNSEIRWYFSDNLSIDFAFGLLHREDLKLMYNHKVLFNTNGTISITLQSKR